MIKKGIILSGGTGSRLFPATKAVNKQLMLLYDKPVIYYPLSVLMLSGIKDILIIVNSGQVNNFRKLLGDGKNFGIKISYLEQNKPTGIPEAFIIGEKFINKENVALILGDNFFYGQSLGENLKNISKRFRTGCNIFLKKVKNSSQFGVALIKKNKIIKIIEKPINNVSDEAITGLYFFDKNVSKLAATLKKSKRGETEITDLIKKYKNNKIKFTKLGIGSIWSDTGTVEDMHEVSKYIASIDRIQNFKIACLEEIALIKKWITKKKLLINLKKSNISNEYSKYLKNIIN